MKIKNNRHVNDLIDGEALSRLKMTAEAAGVCMFETILPEPPFSARPMTPVKITEEGTLWFFSNKDSRKNKEITANPHVQLIFCNSQAKEFINIYGTAEIITDVGKFKDLWTPAMREWFPEGLRDQTLSLIKVVPESSFYWDARHKKMTAVIQLTAAGQENRVLDDSVKGALHI